MKKCTLVMLGKCAVSEYRSFIIRDSKKFKRFKRFKRFKKIQKNLKNLKDSKRFKKI